MTSEGTIADRNSGQSPGVESSVTGAVDAKQRELSGLTRAAMLLVSLGSEAAAAITKFLNENEVESLSAEIMALGTVSAEDKRWIVHQFYREAKGSAMGLGGEEYAKQILINSLGERKAKAILNKHSGSGGTDYFGLISNVDGQSIANFLKNEHSQTIALVLSTLPTEEAGRILMYLPEEMRPPVAYRMATIEKPSQEVISEIQAVLGDYVMKDISDLGATLGGTTHVAETFNEIDQSVWKSILDEIEEIDSDIAEDIKNKMFTFADLVLLDDKSVQTILKEIDSQDLALALKGGGDDVKDLIFRNMSKRASSAVKEEMEYLGPVRVSEVEAAQQRIIDVVQQQEAEGAIYISGRGGDKGGLIE